VTKDSGTAIASAPARVVPWSVLFAGITVVAFATLVFELSLIRVFSFTIWHHFGYVVISTALLGYGASGTFLAIRPGVGARDPRVFLAICALLCSLTMVATLVFVSLFPLDPMAILRQRGQLALFLAYQAAVAVPFFFSGLLISVVLRDGATRVDRLYGFDLVGAGLGCLCAVVLMNWITPPGAAVVAAAAMAVAAAAYARRGIWLRLASVLAALLFALSGFADRLPFTPAASKEQAQLVNLLGAKPILKRWTALFRTEIVETIADPGARFPGISRIAPPGVDAPAYVMNHDATAGAPIYDLRDDAALAWIDYQVLRLPYVVARRDPKVLVIGVGGGRDVLVASKMGAAEVTGAELDPEMVDLLRNELDVVAEGFFRRPEIRLVASEGRHFIRSARSRYDVIQLTGVDTLSAINNGAYVLAENYLYTVEAISDFLDRLTPAGILSFCMGNMNADEPQAPGRLVSVASEALRRRGVADPRRHLAVVDSGKLFVEVMIKAMPFRPEQVDRLAEEIERLEMVSLMLPGRQGHPVFERLAAATGAERDRLLSELRFRIDATTDDNPFFFDFFRWRDLLEPGTLQPSHSSALGQIVLVGQLLSLTLLGAVFVLLPLLVFHRQRVGGTGAQRAGLLVYFLAVGLGFMLFEISLIQRFVLLLGYPTYSLSVTLFSLLLFLGFGSYVSRYFVASYRRALPLAVLALALLVVFYVEVLPSLQERILATSLLVRSAFTIAAQAPLGLVMGLFFPIGIRLASSLHADLVPWAWAANGCASVTAGVLAVVLAMTWGFTIVWLLSIAIYATGVVALLAATRHLDPPADASWSRGDRRVRRPEMEAPSAWTAAEGASSPQETRNRR
jgi:SAM-dependent methyltransferase